MYRNSQSLKWFDLNWFVSKIYKHNYIVNVRSFRAVPRGRSQRRPAAPDPDPVPPPAPRRRRMDRAQRVNDDNAPRVEDRQPEAPLPANDAQPIPVQLRQDEIDRVTANVLQHIRDTGNQQQIPISLWTIYNGVFGAPNVCNGAPIDEITLSPFIAEKCLLFCNF